MLSCVTLTPTLEPGWQKMTPASLTELVDQTTTYTRMQELVFPQTRHWAGHMGITGLNVVGTVAACMEGNVKVCA